MPGNMRNRPHCDNGEGVAHTHSLTRSRYLCWDARGIGRMSGLEFGTAVGVVFLRCCGVRGRRIWVEKKMKERMGHRGGVWHRVLRLVLIS